MKAMIVQLASDLHLERLARRFPGETLIRPAPQAELLVLAGDIAARADGVRLFADWPVPVLYVPGNHEFFDADWQHTREELRRAAEGTRVRILDGDECVLGGVRWLGCTLWTDYALQEALDPSACLQGRAAPSPPPVGVEEPWGGPAFPQGSPQGQAAPSPPPVGVEEPWGGPAFPQEQMQACARRMRDHAVIRVGARMFAPEDALAEHRRCRAWLERTLAQSFSGPTVVVTHHAPSARSVHPRFAGHPVNPAYASRLEPLMAGASVWLHGHVHDSFDYLVQGPEGHACRVVTNPRGNARRIDQAGDPSDLEFENPAFRPDGLIRL